MFLIYFVKYLMDIGAIIEWFSIIFEFFICKIKKHKNVLLDILKNFKSHFINICLKKF